MAGLFAVGSQVIAKEETRKIHPMRIPIWISMDRFSVYNRYSLIAFMHSQNVHFCVGELRNNWYPLPKSSPYLVDDDHVRVWNSRLHKRSLRG